VVHQLSRPGVPITQTVCLPLASLGKEVARTIVCAKSQYGYRLLNETKDKARELGIFGAPTLAVG
jgi:hypothetical protein